MERAEVILPWWAKRLLDQGDPKCEMCKGMGLLWRIDWIFGRAIVPCFRCRPADRVREKEKQAQLKAVS